MKKVLFGLAAGLLIAGSANAERVFNPGSVTTEILMDATSVNSDISHPNFAPYHVGALSNGKIAVISDPSSGTGTDGVFITVNPDGTGMTAVLTEASVISQAGLGNTDIDYNGAVTSGTVIYFTDFQDDDSVVSVDMNSGVANNIATLASLSPEEIAISGSDLYIRYEQFFGGDDNIYTIDAAASSGTPTLFADLVTAGIADTVGLSSLPDGRFITFSNGAFGGDDNWHVISADGTTVSQFFADATDADGVDGVTSFTTDAEGNIYVNDFFSSVFEGIRVIEAETNAVYDILSRADYLTLIGAAGFDDSSSQVMAARIVDDNSVELYVCDRNAQTVAKITIPTTVTSVPNWNMY